MRFDPILCDFDGTIADSAPVIIHALESACDELQVEIPVKAELALCVGPPLERTLPAVLGDHVPVAEIIASYRRHYMRVAPTKTPLMAGAKEALAGFKAHGARVGVVTFKPLPLIEAILKGLRLSPFIDAVSAPPLDTPPVSKTALLRDALAALSPNEYPAVFIGDHDDDQHAAQEVHVEFLRFPDKSWSDLRADVLGA